MAFPPPLDGYNSSYSLSGSVQSHASFSGSDTISEADSSVSSAYTIPAKRFPNMGKIERLKQELEELQLSNQIVDARKDAAKHAGPSMPTMFLPFFVPKEKMQAMQQAFPRTTFRCTADNAHDHPWAHTETMIATNSALRLVPAGHTIIDLFGKPAAADKFVKTQSRSNKPKRMFGYQALKTERDYVRSLDWGNETAEDGRRRYIIGNGRPDSDIDMPISDQGVVYDGELVPGKELTWLCNHTFYYLSDIQIARLLKPKGSRMLAVVLKHSADNGEMFMGEMTYARRSGMIEQVNRHTGERYIHRDISYLWTSKDKVVRTPEGAYAWTFHMVSVDTWIVRLTGVPMALDERFGARSKAIGVVSACYEMNEHDQGPSTFNHPSLACLPATEVVMVGSVPIVKILGDQHLSFRLTNLDFFEFLSVKMIGRPRTPEILHDMFAIARAACDTSGSQVGGKSFRVAANDVPDHVVLAFLSGISREVELFAAVEAYGVQRKEHANLVNGRGFFQVGVGAPQTLGKSALSVARHFNTVRTSSDVITGLLEVLD